MKKTLIVLVVLIAIFGLYALGVYNGLVKGNEAMTNQWAQVETQYQRRLDLIPNLVNSVKGVMKQEQAVFTALADARARYAGATTVDQKAKAATEVESSLGRLLVVVENYPQLRSSETVAALMAELVGTENRVAVERKRFNDLVQSYNLKVKTFPGSIVAGMFGFGEKAYFQAASGAEKAPNVDL